MYCVYVSQSPRDKKLYIGHTNNLVKRIGEHNRGLIKSTRNRRPFRLLYYEASNLLKDAVLREKSLKTGFGRAHLKRRITDL